MLDKVCERIRADVVDVVSVKFEDPEIVAAVTYVQDHVQSLRSDVIR